MDTQTKSPKITHLSWGQLQVEEGATYKDAKLWPGGSREWDWTETGTSHTPGVQPEDLEEILEHGAKTVILSRGMNRRLQVQQQTLEWLQNQGIEVHVLQTKEAVVKYNQLAETEPVGALIHSTC
ncbi:MAG TPA: Mth938-like domain-containing protein [bacterium]|nr:Mth938-like domain-containing protein [bacterium]